MEAVRLSNLPEVRGSCWWSHRQNASSSAPLCIFLPQPWLWFVLCEPETGTRKRLRNYILSCIPTGSGYASKPTRVPAYMSHYMKCHQHRSIVRLKLLEQPSKPTEAYAFPSCLLDLVALKPGIPQLIPAPNGSHCLFLTSLRTFWLHYF